MNYNKYSSSDLIDILVEGALNMKEEMSDDEWEEFDENATAIKQVLLKRMQHGEFCGELKLPDL